MAKKSMIAKNKRPAKFSTQAYTQFTANSNFAVYASATWLTLDRFRA